ncbi:glutathione S-transferase family protein [Kaarinaea lacus]
MKPELISFKLCPFVQRSVIILLEKGIDYDITYIDLKNPPDWFLDISPFGKVPVLRYGQTVLFESAVINEFLDETHPPSLHPSDPLLRAQNRACIEFGSQLNLDIGNILGASDENEFDEKCRKVKSELARVESKVSDGPFYNGEAFSLVDVAYAPPLMRLRLLNQFYHVDLLASLPKIQAWAEELSQRESVQRSVVPDFAQLFQDSISARKGYINSLK